MVHNVPLWVVFSCFVLGLYPVYALFFNKTIDSIEVKSFYLFIPMAIGLYFEIGIITRFAKVVCLLKGILFMFIAILFFIPGELKIDHIPVQANEHLYHISIPCVVLGVFLFLLSKNIVISK